MTKSSIKKSKGTISTKKKRKNVKGRTKSADCVHHLIELHKIQEVLLIQLSKEV